jgi:hypothetical protein
MFIFMPDEARSGFDLSQKNLPKRCTERNIFVLTVLVLE